MKNTFRKSSLISSVALLLVVIVALSGATFAWFSQQKSASAGKLNMTAQSASGLYIAEDTDLTSTTAPTSGWGSKITWTGETSGMVPVSGAFTDGKPTFFTTSTGNSDGTWDGEAQIVPAVEGQYLVKKIWVKADTADEVTLTITPTVSVKEGGKRSTYERMAIVNGTTAQIMGVEAETVKAFTDTTGDKNAVDVASVVYKNFTWTGKLDTAQCFYVYCWFEGQDKDCKNANSGANFTVDLAFAI